MLTEKSHIRNVLQDVLKALQTENYSEIKLLSNKIIHQASIEQDPDVVSLAVIIYSLSKILEREAYKTEKNWNSFYNLFVKNIKEMINALEENNLEKFRGEIAKNRELIKNLSGNLKRNIEDVFRKARINKASRIYEHGISMEKTAKILGITIWELAEYAGSTTSEAGFTVTMPVKQRVKLAEEVFG